MRAFVSFRADPMDPASCPLCACHESVSFPIFYEFLGDRFEARECTACGFVYLHPRPTRAQLAQMYSDEYFLHDEADCGAHSATDYETAARQGSVKFPEILGWIKRYRPAGRFFEIGCGMGYFLDFARRNGYDVSGIEYAALGAKACREKFGLEVTQSSIEAFPETVAAYDVIFMGDVLEHLVDPLEMLKKAVRMLKPGGVIAAEVPAMFNSLTGRLAVAGYRILRTRKRMPMPPYHVNEFLPATLDRILRESGCGTRRIVQRIRPPRMITLRGSFAEKTIKKGLHYPNYALTKGLGVFGDRLLGIGIKAEGVEVE
jgi:2-polyprenyl-3-methyl-5-hydroxy-6-metoxy-1,4-benzoquinol methylase